MSYLPYIIAAYAIFGGVLLWDLVAPQLQVRRELRAARLRMQREPAQQKPVELSR